MSKSLSTNVVFFVVEFDLVDASTREDEEVFHDC
jgi:hypothetical protein